MRDKPWVTNEFRRLVRKRNRLWKRFRRTNNPEHYQVYKRVRNAAVSLSHKCIKDYANSVDIQLQHNDDPKIWWKKVNALLTSKGHQSLPPIIDTPSGKIVSSDYEKANIFNQYFTEQCTVPDDAKELPDFSYITHFRLSDMVITDSEVLAQLTSLKGSKATGPDAIGNILMKNVAVAIYPSLVKLFNYSLHKQHFPSAWKLANVCPVFKKGDNKISENYRPISLLSNTSKVFEKVVHDRLYNYLTNHNLLIPNNSGFKHGDSTINQ